MPRRRRAPSLRPADTPRAPAQIALLSHHKRLASTDFDGCVRIVDDACVDMVRKYDVTREPPHRDLLDLEHKELCAQLLELDAEFARVLSGHISPKNIDALSEVIRYFGTPANLGRFISTPAMMAELGTIAESLRRMYGLDEPPSTPKGDSKGNLKNVGNLESPGPVAID